MNTLHKNYLVVANGNFLVKEIIQEISRDKIIIALDEAADKLARMGILPQILLGDFDAENAAHFTYWGIRPSESETYTGNHYVTIVPKKNQHLTDLMKAIQYCDEQQAASIHVICAAGGRLDHHEAAMRSLRTNYKKQRELLLHTEQQTLRFIKDESLIIQGQIKDNCAVLAFPHAVFSSHGLWYDVENYELNFGYSESFSNSLRFPNAHIQVKGEALVMLPPHFKSQREFMQKSEREKMQLLIRDMTT